MAIGDFVRDPSKVRTQRYKPPEGHPRRCQSFKRRERVQCSNWALKGYDFCRYHIGPQGRSSLTKVKGLYGKVVKGRLGKFLEAAAIDEERQSIAGEVDVARAVASEALAVVSKVINADEHPGVEVDESLKLAALSVARDSLEHVTRLVERMVKIDVMSKATLNAHQFDAILQRILNLIGLILTDEVPEKAQHILALITSGVNEVKIDEKREGDAGPTVSINIT